MYGAILGDIIGSPYEFTNGTKTKEFSLFRRESTFTDDSVLTIAICDAIFKAGLDADEKTMKKYMVESCKKWAWKYKQCGYGSRFFVWYTSDSNEPYGSFGNGSAMRVSSVGWLFDSLERTWEVARWSAEITHNHPEGIKGAEATATVIWLARNGKTKEEIKEYIEKEFGYDLNRSFEELVKTYQFEPSCQKTVPEAIIAFLNGNSFEDVIRTAVAIGGDCDTLTCIAGGMAHAFYGIPENLYEKVMEYTTEDMHSVMKDFFFFASSKFTDEKGKKINYIVEPTFDISLTIKPSGE